MILFPSLSFSSIFFQLANPQILFVRHYSCINSWVQYEWSHILFCSFTFSNLFSQTLERNSCRISHLRNGIFLISLENVYHATLFQGQSYLVRSPCLNSTLAFIAAFSLSLLNRQSSKKIVILRELYGLSMFLMMTELLLKTEARIFLEGKLFAKLNKQTVNVKYCKKSTTIQNSWV